jgi:uncharacterized protein
MSDDPAPPSISRCPICKSDATLAYKPFCSKRCADIDLGRWFKGSYVVAGRDDDEDADRDTRSQDDGSGDRSGN